MWEFIKSWMSNCYSKNFASIIKSICDLREKNQLNFNVLDIYLTLAKRQMLVDNITDA